jgi:hypothetical protein
MYMKVYFPLFVIIFCLGLSDIACSQVTISGQVRTRSEFREGQGLPQQENAVPAFFTSQRTRVNVGYAAYRFKLYASIQDVRVWGQDASTIHRTTNDAYDGLMMHEAWGEINLLDTTFKDKTLALKIGRQELVYDDVRLLGNLDWLQQARRHDAALLKFTSKGFTAHLGAAFNQNSERKLDHIYNGVPTGYAASTNGMGANYKSMQFLYLAQKLPFGTGSLLFFKDDFSKYSFAATDSLKATPIYGRGVHSRYTIGGNLFGTASKKIALGLSAFYQGGEYRDGTDLSEYLISLNAMYSVTKKFSVGPGVDITSGNNGSDPTKRNQRFDPLYGTPHKFWGYMDYFYVADGFGPNGLVNYYLKAKYKAKDNLLLSLDAHQFQLSNSVTSTETGKSLSKSLGTELDFIVNYSLTKIINIEGGYCTMFSTDTMVSSKVKNVKNADKQSNWAYLMISIKPELILK